MTHNDRGLRVSGEPVKRHIVRVELDVEVTGQPNADTAKGHVENAVGACLTHGVRLGDYEMRFLGRPNAKRATVAPEEGIS